MYPILVDFDEYSIDLVSKFTMNLKMYDKNNNIDNIIYFIETYIYNIL